MMLEPCPMDSYLPFLANSAEQILLSDLSHLVIDEADTLFDHSFVEATTSIIRNIEVGVRSTQYITQSPLVSFSHSVLTSLVAPHRHRSALRSPLYRLPWEKVPRSPSSGQPSPTKCFTRFKN